MPKKRQLLQRRTHRATDRNSNAMHELAARELLDVLNNTIWNTQRFQAIMRLDPSSLRLKLDDVKQV
jgi:hypothetical protein